MYANWQWRPRLGAFCAAVTAGYFKQVGRREAVYLCAFLPVVTGGDFKKVGRREAIYLCEFALAPTPGHLLRRCDRRGL